LVALAVAVGDWLNANALVDAAINAVSKLEEVSLEAGLCINGMRPSLVPGSPLKWSACDHLRVRYRLFSKMQPCALYRGRPNFQKGNATTKELGRYSQELGLVISRMFRIWSFNFVRLIGQHLLQGQPAAHRRLKESNI